jgi:hypothetical protein
MWAKFCDTFWAHPKILAAGNEAVGAFARMVSYCGSQLTDGHVPTSVARTIATPSVLKRLVAGGLLDEAPGGYSVHDFLAYNPSRSKVLAQRESTAERVAVHRGNKANRAVGNGVTNHVTNAVSNAGVTPVVTTSRPDPTRPVGETTSLSSVPGEAPSTDRAPVAKATKATKVPPPFTIGEAFEALAESAEGRFAAGVERDWTKGVRIAVAGHVRAYPDLGAWRCVGAWLAAGAERHRGTVGPSWAASGALPDAMARSRQWDADGRPSLDGRRRIEEAPAVDLWATARRVS